MGRISSILLFSVFSLLWLGNGMLLQQRFNFIPSPGTNYSKIDHYNYTDINTSLEIDMCDGSLVRTVNVSVEDVKTWYHYRQNNKLTTNLTKLKVNGGDCYDYSVYYSKLYNLCGYVAEVKVIPVGLYSSHSFTIVRDEFSYCVVDQTRHFCTVYG